jgi:hypothetical protein
MCILGSEAMLSMGHGDGCPIIFQRSKGQGVVLMGRKFMVISILVEFQNHKY